MTIWVSCFLRRSGVRRRAVERVVRHGLSELGHSSVGIAVTFVGDRTMRRLNRDYRLKDRPTDVLAFAMREASQSPPNRLLLGDVVISVPMARRHAKEAGHTVDHELTVLIVHGLLHLCGYDHERTARDARRMFRKEREVLNKLGRMPKILVEPSSPGRRHGLV
ncbi:endoribonuclease YbeY [Nitrospira sp.]|nr:endoribonuclease YbeY [Nitrospira sp.]